MMVRVVVKMESATDQAGILLERGSRAVKAAESACEFVGVRYGWGYSKRERAELGRLFKVVPSTSGLPMR